MRVRGLIPYIAFYYISNIFAYLHFFLLCFYCIIYFLIVNYHSHATRQITLSLLSTHFPKTSHTHIQYHNKLRHPHKKYQAHLILTVSRKTQVRHKTGKNISFLWFSILCKFLCGCPKLFLAST